MSRGSLTVGEKLHSVNNNLTYRIRYRQNPYRPVVMHDGLGASFLIQFATSTFRGYVRSVPATGVEVCFIACNNIQSCIHKTVDSVAASGNRNRTSGALNNVGSNGNYWSFASNSQANAYNLNFNSSNLNPLNNNNRANGFAVRPCRALRDRVRYVFS